MKLFTLLFLATPVLLLGQARNPATPAAPPPPSGPPVSTAPARPPQQPPISAPAPAGGYIYEQKGVQGAPTLVAPDQAQGIIGRFRTNYTKLGQPRMLIYVNRDLVDEKTGLRLSGRTERTETTRNTLEGNYNSDGKNTPGNVNVTAGGSVNVNSGAPLYPGSGAITGRTDKVSNENTYKVNDRNESLADRQTFRDVQVLFGRPLRAAGVRLADQRLATQLIGDKPLKEFTVSTESEGTRKEREALTRVADVVVEVLISSRTITSQEVSGDKNYVIPDIQATAMRLSDAQVLGQATAADILGKDRFAGKIARNFDVREIAEATALALMEDINTANR